MEPYPLASIEQTLNELDVFARSTSSSYQFAQKVLKHLRLALQSEAVAFLIPSGRALVTAVTDGNWPQEVGHMLSSNFDPETALTTQFQSGQVNGKTWFVNGVQNGTLAKGCLAASFEGAIDSRAVVGLEAVMQAFAELIGIRQGIELEKLFERDLAGAHRLLVDLSKHETLDAASMSLVNGLAALLPASRVSLVGRGGLSKGKLYAVSGISTLDRKSHVVKSLINLGRQALQNDKPIVHQSPRLSSTSDIASVPESQNDSLVEESGLFINRIATKFASSNDRNARSGIIIEFADEAALMNATFKLQHLLPNLAVGWEQKQQWLQVPKYLRSITDVSRSVRQAVGPFLRLAMLIGLVFLAAYLLLMPMPMVIEGEGKLEPIEFRYIYASADGFIDQLLVQDGQAVETNTPLLTLRSPSLDLQIEEAQGEYRAIDEEAKGLQIAINQLSANSNDLLNQQSILASKISAIELRKTTLERQLQILVKRRKSLTLNSPIKGMIVAKDIQQQLLGRPVQRGDALFSVVDMDGPWQVRMKVFDRDSGYVLGDFGLESEHKKADFEFVIDSDVETRHRAKLNWIADYVENLHREGCFLEMRANVIDFQADKRRFGAGVHTYFPCQPQPVWFVWCRPIVEAFQRRVWF